MHEQGSERLFGRPDFYEFTVSEYEKMREDVYRSIKCAEVAPDEDQLEQLEQALLSLAMGIPSAALPPSAFNRLLASAGVSYENSRRMGRGEEGARSSARVMAQAFLEQYLWGGRTDGSRPASTGAGSARLDGIKEGCWPAPEGRRMRPS